MKPTLLYYTILNYRPENIRLLHDNFEVITVRSPDDDNVELLQRVNVILAPLGYYCGREKISQCSKLNIIGSNTTGHAHIDVEYAQSKNIIVVTLKNHTDFLKKITPTAEHTWGLLLALTRNTMPAFQSVLSGGWDRRPFGGAAMLSRMSLGIAGYGRLGTIVASYGRCFSMKVRFYDPFVPQERVDIEKVSSLENLVSMSDVVTIHIPHERETENMFDKAIFSCFKRGSYLINTSRGELIDEDALLKALEEGKIAGAALDVLREEFTPQFGRRVTAHPLVEYARTHTNLIITPHIGGSTLDAWRLTEEYTINKIIELVRTENRKKKPKAINHEKM